MSHEDISESWEELDETKLEERLETERVKRDMATTNQNGLAWMGSANGTTDDFKPRILQRPKAQQNQIKILKRPESSSSLSNQQGGGGNSKPQMKTLEQREKEYAEARKRILGTAEIQIANEQQNIKSAATVAYNKLSPSSSSNCLQNFSQQSPTPLQQYQRIPDNVIRLPKGPNSSGFNIRR